MIEAVIKKTSFTQNLIIFNHHQLKLSLMVTYVDLKLPFQLILIKAAVILLAIIHFNLNY